jgi:hypothetical protein
MALKDQFKLIPNSKPKAKKTIELIKKRINRLEQEFSIKRLHTIPCQRQLKFKIKNWRAKSVVGSFL